jgi:hypothetical protein
MVDLIVWVMDVLILAADLEIFVLQDAIEVVAEQL